MKYCYFLLAVTLILCTAAFAKPDEFRFATLNCYWFFGDEHSKASKNKRPTTPEDCDKKAGHLIGLLSDHPPLFVAVQEIGNSNDVARLSHAAEARYKLPYESLFVQGRDHNTRQDVGALFTPAFGWGVYGKPARVGDLEKELTKHLVVRLTNAITQIDLCVVHLRVPRGNGSNEKQEAQLRALLRWSMRHLAKNPRANLMILGDFNEHRQPNDPAQALNLLLTKSRPPLIDALGYSVQPSEKMRVATHDNGKALDRIILSDSLVKGTSHLVFQSVTIGSHRHGRAQAVRYTDHFPVTVELQLR